MLEKVEEEKEEINIVENLTKLVNEFLRNEPKPDEENLEKLTDLCEKIEELYGKGLLDDEFVLMNKIYEYYMNKDDEYIEEILAICRDKEYIGYYDRMASAWLIADCMVKYPEKIYEYLPY